MDWPDLDPDAVAIRWLWAAYEDARQRAADAYWAALEEEAEPMTSRVPWERSGALWRSHCAAWYETLLEGLCFGNEGGEVGVLYVHPDGDGVMVFVPLPERLKPAADGRSTDMASCIGAQQANRRLARLEAELARQRALVRILAAAVGVDLDRLAHLERLARRGDYPATWADMVALGRDPDGSAA